MKKIRFIILLLIVSYGSLFSQGPENLKISKNVVIENAMIISSAGKSPQKGVIVIENGIITQIGNNVNIPKDAIRIKADSLYAYPAFIDACSHTGVPKTDTKEKPEEIKDPDNPGYEKAGITPNITISDVLKITDSSVEEMRKQGFAISHVVPRGRMIAGQGSIILLNDKNNTPFLKNNFSLKGSLESAKGRVYPSTVIAVMAKYRNLIEQSKNALKHENQYMKNPVGLQRPNYDLEIQALYPLIQQKQSLFITAEKTLEISRVISLNEDLKIPMVLVETKQNGPNIKKLKDKNYTVLVSLALPDAYKEEKIDSTKTVDEKRMALIARKKSSIEAYEMNTKMMLDNNMFSGFSYLEVSPKDIHSNLKRIIKTGVSEDDILDALTMKPAKLLGIDQVAGSLEKGKIGNIILSKELIFSEENQLVYTIVEGEIFKHEMKDSKKKKTDKEGQGATSGIDGKWRIAADVGGTTESGTLEITKTENGYSGIMIDEDDEETILENIKFENNTISFDFGAEMEGQMIRISLKAEVSEDSFEGEITIEGFGVFPVTGTKINKPN